MYRTGGGTGRSDTKTPVVVASDSKTDEMSTDFLVQACTTTDNTSPASLGANLFYKILILFDNISWKV